MHPDTDTLIPKLAQTPGRRHVFESMVKLLKTENLSYNGGFKYIFGEPVHYLEYGSGHPLILIHGYGGGGATWYKQISKLAETHRVIIPDNPLFGLSYQPIIKTPLRQFALEYITAFMDALQLERATIVGMSLGGIPALEISLKAPERVENLVIINSLGLGIEIPWFYRVTSIPFLGRILTTPNHFLTSLALKVAITSRDITGREELVQYIHETRRRERAPAAIYAGMRASFGLKGQRYIYTDDELQRIKVPTLVLWGRKDTHFPVAHGERAARLVPNARLEILEDTGHLVHWERPDTVLDILTSFIG